MQHKQCKMHINNVKSPLRPYQTVQFRSCNLKCNSTLRSCKISNIPAPSQLTNIFLTCQTFVTNLHLLRVELRCKLQEKLHRATGPLISHKLCQTKHAYTTNGRSSILMSVVCLRAPHSMTIRDWHNVMRKY